MNVLITGGRGFIGEHLLRDLRYAGHEAHGVDRQDGFDLRKPGVLLHEIEVYEPDVVVHLAATVGRMFGEEDPVETVSNNAGLTALVSKACGDTNIHLVYASTSEVYGDQGQKLCIEGGPLRLPHNLYGLSKRWGEEAARLYCDDPTILRLSMPYGPGLPPGKGRAAIINLLWQAMHRHPMIVHRNSERSWCWVGDTVRGIRAVLESKEGGVWNVGRDDNAVPMRTVAEIACNLVGADPHKLIEEVDPPGMQTVVKRLATNKLRSLGWRPEVELEDGMQRTLRWLLEPAPF